MYMVHGFIWVSFLDEGYIKHQNDATRDIIHDDTFLGMLVMKNARVLNADMT